MGWFTISNLDGSNAIETRANGDAIEVRTGGVYRGLAVAPATAGNVVNANYQTDHWAASGATADGGQYGFTVPTAIDAMRATAELHGYDLATWMWLAGE